ncbi:hypothetical protein B1987_13675 [Mycobacterium kansasii]|uniref:Uncharacterized protein n=2 Tax=Mycobacterium attenuatum TaxID=2341086 RepID=A0A498QCD6_9MYCO|nr:hypothetical protein B1987_13675 [Mycobacterium kansasii]VBA43948.1 hypothetical protein LAUMK136_05354 [Mycobacterium attenuatum]
MGMSRIFDDFERTDPGPASDMESSYHFLNRVARPEWQLVRDLIDEWFSEYPEPAQPDLRSRLKDDDYVQHIGAWWELYTYTLFRRLGYQVSIHPVLINTGRQPDFLVTREDVSMYVECVIFLSKLGARSGQGGERSWIFEATNQARDPNFMVDIEIRRSGAQRPKADEIVRPLENWLSSLDPDEVTEQIEAGMGVPNFVLSARGWTIEYGAFPVNPENRGEESRRLIGMYPMTGGFIDNDMLRYRDTVKHKGGHYGLPDKPFMVAVLNTSGFLEHDDVAAALFGREAIEYYQGQRGSVKSFRRRDGYWRQGPPKRGSRVSAVLDGENIYPWRASAQLPKLWVNPWAEKPLTATLPSVTFTANDSGEVHQTETGISPEAVFGLGADWPGFAR